MSGHRLLAALPVRWPWQARPQRAATATVRAVAEAPTSTLFLQPPILEAPALKIRIAKRQSVLQDALGLINQRYGQRGYGFQTLTLSPERITIVAYGAQHVVGTLTVQLDNAQGLLSDACFPDELEGLRREGAALCEFIKLASAPDAPMPATLASMFHVAYIYAHQLHGATHVAVEVNPRHVAFYRRILGFTQRGAVRTNGRVDAPGALLVGDFAHIGRQLRARGAHGGAAASGKPPPFFSHSFSDAEERAIRRRIESTLAALRRSQPSG